MDTTPQIAEPNPLPTDRTDHRAATDAPVVLNLSNDEVSFRDTAAAMHAQGAAAMAATRESLSQIARRSVLTGMMQTLQRLQTWSLRGFSSQWHTTRVGLVHTLQWGRPSATHASWVFIHGYASSAADWAPLLRRMTRHCAHIVAIDLPGHGRSPVPADGIHEANLLTALHDTVTCAIADALRCVAVGNSTGGLGAVRLAQALQHQQVSELVLISPLGSPMASAEIDQVLSAFVIDDFRAAHAFVNKLWVNPTPLHWLHALAIWGHLKRPHLVQMLSQLQHLRFLNAEEMRALPPTLLIWGGSDRILPASGRTFFANTLTECTLIPTQRFGHVPFLDYPDDVETAILAWAAQRPGLITT